MFLLSEVQTYLIRINISEELGCYRNEEDGPKCYSYYNFDYVKQYRKAVTLPFRRLKLRTQILGVSISHCQSKCLLYWVFNNLHRLNSQN